MSQLNPEYNGCLDILFIYRKLHNNIYIARYFKRADALHIK